MCANDKITYVKKCSSHNPKMIFHKIIEENKGVHFFKKNKGFNTRQQFFFSTRLIDEQA